MEEKPEVENPTDVKLLRIPGVRGTLEVQLDQGRSYVNEGIEARSGAVSPSPGVSSNLQPSTLLTRVQVQGPS